MLVQLPELSCAGEGELVDPDGDAWPVVDGDEEGVRADELLRAVSQAESQVSPVFDRPVAVAKVAQLP